MNGSATASTSHPTQTESNRALARRFFHEVWNDRRDETIDELLDPAITAHMEGAEFTGTAPYKETRRNLLQAFPDFRVAVEETAADGDHVVVRWNARGTPAGPGWDSRRRTGPSPSAA